MNLLFAALTIAGGLFAASSWIVSRTPRASEAFSRLAPYRGMVGVAMLALGTWWAIRALPQIGGLLASAPFAGSITLSAIAANLAIGFLLGFGVLQPLLAKSDASNEQSMRLHAKLATVQAPLGLAAIALGVLVML